MDHKKITEFRLKFEEEETKNIINTGISTKCVHGGQEPDIVYGCVNVPIYMSSTFAQTSPAEPFGPFDYSRCGNPTRNNLERAVSILENGKHTISWGSGMAAITGIISLLKTGEECICIDDVYGGTQRFFRKISQPNHGVVYKFLKFDDISKLEKEINDKTKMMWMEVVTNPTLGVPDVIEIVKMVRRVKKDIIIVVDNTFMSPVNCNPLDFGVDIVCESATKYINGHCDVVMGLTTTNDDKLNEDLFFISKSTGGVPSPFDCYLTLRGIKTLGIRIKTINNNAMAIAQYLEKHPKVSKVLYPGLESSPYHAIIKKLVKGHGYGGIVSFVIKGGLDEASKFLKKLKIFRLAESLGGVESLAEHPPTMTHASVAPELRAQIGIEDGFIRLSVGIEEKEDLLKDLEESLKD